MKKRIIVIATLFLTVLFLLNLRLTSLQLLHTESFGSHQVNLLEKSVEQRIQTIQIDDGRGHFLDRHGNALAYSEKKVVIMFPFLAHHEWDKQKLAALLSVPVTDIESALTRHTKPFAFLDPVPYEITDSQLQEINSWNIPGLIATEKYYAKERTYAEHLLGITRQDPKQLHNRYKALSLPSSTPIGIEGLQATFDSFVLPEMDSRLMYHVDAIGRPLFGLHVKYAGNANPYYPLAIRTTIDTAIQQEVEQVLDTYNVTKGGIAIIDIANSEVVAMASRPLINQQDPYKGNSVANRLLTPSFPGSVFKTVVLAAALEEGVTRPTDQFDCNYNVLGTEKTETLGILNVEESFAQSCNATFGELGERLMKKDPNLLAHYSELLGITEHPIWQGDVYHELRFNQLPSVTGTLFSEPAHAKQKGIVRQTAIGQQDVEVTPLAVANMMATVARGGEKKLVKVVASIEYKNGSPLFVFPDKTVNKQVISPITMSHVQKNLHAVVTSPKGTGRWFQNLPVDLAGKTGTAQTGKYRDGQPLYHKWFAGYYPFHAPKYAFVVVNEDVTEQEGGPNPLVIELLTNLSRF